MKYLSYPFSSSVIAITTTTACGNMAFQVVEDKNPVFENRSYLLKDLNIDKEHLVLVHQTHSDVIKEATSLDLGAGSTRFDSGIEADALYTKEKGIAIGVFHADCAPIFFCDETINLVGVIHAGHKGTLKHITAKALSYIINKEKVNPINLKIWIGPLRRKETYKVSVEQKMEIICAGCSIVDDYFDVTLSNKYDMISLGVPEENIHDSGIDTAKDDNFYSVYKGDKEGRMISLIMNK